MQRPEHVTTATHEDSTHEGSTHEDGRLEDSTLEDSKVNVAVTPQAWGTEQVETLVQAVQAAPSVLGSRPWQLRVAANWAELLAVPDHPLGEVDPLGRAGLLSCGAAVRNIALAVGHLGYRPAVRLGQGPGDPALVATVTAGPVVPCPEHDEALYRAIFRRHSYRGPFADRSVTPALTLRLHEAGSTERLTSLPIGGEQLQQAATVLAAAVNEQLADERYLADIERWLHGHDALGDRYDPKQAFPRSGVVRRETPQADPARLAGQLRRGRLFLLVTVDDGHQDWVRAGWALQNMWLTATSLGLAGSVLTAVLEAPGIRGALTERLELAGFPQALLRVGWMAPATRATRATRRRSDLGD